MISCCCPRNELYPDTRCSTSVIPASGTPTRVSLRPATVSPHEKQLGRTERGASRPSCTTVPRVDAALADRLDIRDVVETWANARDSRDWEAFRACWHEDGYMMATWFQGPKEDFIRVSQEGAARGVNILHFTGGVRITLAGTRAIAQTRMTIMQRADVHGVLCDVACTGRFYDFFEQ